MEGDVSGDDPPGKGALLKRWRSRGGIPASQNTDLGEGARVPPSTRLPTAGDGQTRGGPRERRVGRELETPSVDQGEIGSSFGDTQSPVFQGAVPSEAQPG